MAFGSTLWQLPLFGSAGASRPQPVVGVLPGWQRKRWQVVPEPRVGEAWPLRRHDWCDRLFQSNLYIVCKTFGSDGRNTSSWWICGWCGRPVAEIGHLCQDFGYARSNLSFCLRWARWTMEAGRHYQVWVTLRWSAKGYRRVRNQHGPACKQNAQCTGVSDCVRCAKSGFCTSIVDQYSIVQRVWLSKHGYLQSSDVTWETERGLQGYVWRSKDFCWQLVYP